MRIAADRESPPGPNTVEGMAMEACTMIRISGHLTPFKAMGAIEPLADDYREPFAAARAGGGWAPREAR